MYNQLLPYLNERTNERTVDLRLSLAYHYVLFASALRPRVLPTLDEQLGVANGEYIVDYEDTDIEMTDIVQLELYKIARLQTTADLNDRSTPRLRQRTLD